MTIDTATENDRRQSRLVEATDTHTERAGSFPIAVTPRFTGLAVNEIVTCQFAARLAVDDTDELWACGIIVVKIAWLGRIQVAPRAVVYFSITIGIWNLRAIAKHRSLASTDSHLGTAVAVEVGNSKR